MLKLLTILIGTAVFAALALLYVGLMEVGDRLQDRIGPGLTAVVMITAFGFVTSTVVVLVVSYFGYI